MSIREHHNPSSSPTASKKPRQNPPNAAPQNLNQPSTSSAGSSTPKNECDENTFDSFYNEISDIMRGFGDCERPLRESVELVQKILQQQLRGILHEAMDCAVKRKGVPSPGQIDFEFLMRKHPVKINRLKKHIKDKKLLKKIHEMQAGRTFTTLDDNSDANQDSDPEADTEIVERFDEEKTRRMFRADRISQILSGPQYQEFNNARRTSFYWRHSDTMKHKLRAFISIPADTKLSQICLMILAYLAHETIATIVDFAILTRLDSENRATEPFSRVASSGSTYGMLHLCPEVTQGRGADGLKPIAVKEIQEALRRFNMFARQPIGFHRHNHSMDATRPYLAL